jgi:hypothetical protein
MRCAVAKQLAQQRDGGLRKGTAQHAHGTVGKYGI